MIERTFGNFKGTIDPKSETVRIRGLKYNWKDEYSADQIPGKIEFYKGLNKKRPDAEGYSNMLACLRWAKRMLADD